MDNEKELQKIFIRKEIYHKQSNYPFTWKDIKDFQFEDDDELDIGYDEGFYSENNSWDPHYYVIIYRDIIETDEQFERRINQAKEAKERNRKDRYERYLKLKAEFEPEGN